MKIRRYGKADIPIIIQLMKEFCTTHPFYQTLLFSEPKLTGVLEKNVNNSLFFCDLAITDDGEIVGGMAAMLTGYAISDTRYSEDICGFVKPGHRNGQAIDKLIDEYVAWASARQVHDIRISYTGDKVDGFDALMRRHGFARLGTMYNRSRV